MAQQGARANARSFLLAEPKQPVALRTRALAGIHPFDRGFGTAPRFVSKPSAVISPGPLTALTTLQRPNGDRAIEWRAPTKSQSFSTTVTRFEINDAILVSRCCMPDPLVPGPGTYNVRTRFGVPPRRQRAQPSQQLPSVSSRASLHAASSRASLHQPASLAHSTLTAHNRMSTSSLRTTYATPFDRIADV